MALPNPPEKISKNQKKQVLAAVISKLTEKVFETHFYRWDGKLYLQRQDCPTDFRPSGPVARVFLGKSVIEMLTIAKLSQTLSILNPNQFSKLEIHEIWKYVDDVSSTSWTIPITIQWGQ